ncbi:MAG: glycosyltransferase [Rhodobacteraceae bacterium]|nr:MAG: glycosyltransferase [Paracoccaceae bacterium]
MTRVLFLVTHLAGSGHLTRTLALADGVIAAGGAALVVSGGRPLAHLPPSRATLVQAPPLAVAGFDYRRLLTPDGTAADAAWMAARGARIAEAMAAFAPDVLVTELFPFGRRGLAAEFEAAAQAARARGARVVCSVRDIPEPPRKPARVAEAHGRLRRWFDAVLVHGDPRLAPFALGWPGAAEIADLLRFTGYVAAPPPAPAGDPAEVLVAEGGGALGRGLMRAALGAARLVNRPWRLRLGGADAAAAAARMQAEAGPNGVVEPAAADYRARLGAAAVSVSRFGYNTAVDLLQAGTPAVLVPLDGAEREQRLRAEAFAGLAQFETLAEDALTPETLAAAVERAAARGRGGRAAVDLSGVETGARLLLGAQE